MNPESSFPLCFHLWLTESNEYLLGNNSGSLRLESDNNNKTHRKSWLIKISSKATCSYKLELSEFCACISETCMVKYVYMTLTERKERKLVKFSRDKWKEAIKTLCFS